MIEEAHEAKTNIAKIDLVYVTTEPTFHRNQTDSGSQGMMQANDTVEYRSEGTPRAKATVAGTSLQQQQLNQANIQIARMSQTNITAENSESVPELTDTSSSASYTVHNISGTEYSTARRYLQLLPADQIGNISGLIFQRPELRVFRLLLRLELRCGGAGGVTLRQRLLRRLLTQRHLPELSVSGSSPTAGPAELLLQAVPVLRAGTRRDSRDVFFVAPLPLLAPRLTVQTVRTPSIAASRRQLNFISQPNDSSDGGVGSGDADREQDPAVAALQLSCLGGRARSFISRSQATRLARLQRVRLRAPLFASPPPTEADPLPGEAAPPAVLAGYRYLVQLVQTQFLEREQQQNATFDQLASPMQRMRERAQLVDGAARFFYFTQPSSVYIPPDSYEKLIPEPDGAGVRALPPAMYLDRSEQLQFGLVVPGSASARLVAEPEGLVQTGLSCNAAADGWQRCTASVRPLVTAITGQHRPGEGLRWATVTLDLGGDANNRDNEHDNRSDCDRHPPVPLRVAVGCPPSTTLLFNFTSTFQAAGLAEKCPRCLCNQGVPCLLYSDVFQPRLVLVDWTTDQPRAFTGNYSMTVLGAGHTAHSVPYDSVQRQRNLADRIWAPSVSDENTDIPSELIESPVFPHKLLNGIKWHCGQYSACPPFVRLRFSNADVDDGTFCRHELELVVHLYGVPTNTFVDVVTMSIVFGVTLVVSLVYTGALTVRKKRVTPGASNITDLYPVQEDAQQ